MGATFNYSGWFGLLVDNITSLYVDIAALSTTGSKEGEDG